VSPDVNVTFLECDLASLASVKKAAETFLAESKRLDILLCNAGVMALPPGLTEDGYEIQFGTNHVGHALLLKLLLPTMLQTAERPGSDVRIIALSSMGHQWTTSEGIDFKNLKTTQKDYSTWALYGQSKLANILYAKALARKYPSIKVVAVHPGLVNTNLATSFLNGNVLYTGGFYAASWIPGVIQSPEQGSLNQLWAAFGKSDEVKTGEYYHPIAVAGSASKIATDEKLSDELYDWTQKELASY
jgi:NAD(P)-dependent dehydrogenase (short-subunit alcohol dehydrogenase family)